MKRVAIVGGGIAGLAAAYELELARKAGAAIDWHLYEATGRLGGIIETTRLRTAEGEWILEGGPDAWVSEKPWARELAVELGLESELIYSNDATRKTYIYLDGRLQAMPDRMRMMVPEDFATLETSALFSPDAKEAYADELLRAEELKNTSPLADPAYDESVAAFVLRHFGSEVLEKVASPLLSGVFGGDAHQLSVRAVMAPFVAMEQEHGSLIAALQQRAKERGPRPVQPTFTSLRRGMGSLVESLVDVLPAERLHCGKPVCDLSYLDDEWTFDFVPLEEQSLRQRLTGTASSEAFDHLILATPLAATRLLLNALDSTATMLLPSSDSALSLLPRQASSAVLVSFLWSSHEVAGFHTPSGFGLLVPPSGVSRHDATPELLACTFVDQKFPHRAPAGGKMLRAFFGSVSAQRLASLPDVEVADAALRQLRSLLGYIPEPMHTAVSRWPDSLPQYETGHSKRIAQLNQLIERFELPLHLLGNSYWGVGLPDLIRDARETARGLASF